MEYPKINTLFERNEDFTVKTDCIKDESIAQVKSWLVTEKIHGMNVRVIWNGTEFMFAGRTDKATLPGKLTEFLRSKFTTKLGNTIFNNPEFFYKNLPIVLYGEGYGAGINSGGDLNNNQEFRLFDVLVKDYWVPFNNVCKIAEMFSIKTVPLIARMTMEEIVNLVQKGFVSAVGLEETGRMCIAEGVVGRTDPYLYNSRGGRLVIKLKTEDFRPGKR